MRAESWLGSAGRRLNRIVTTILVLPLLLVAACSHLPPPPPAAEAPADEYVIGPGDQLQVFVWHNTDLSTTVKVRPDGRISIPLIDNVDCAGKTPTELQNDIKKRLETYVKDPHVTVIVNSFNGPFARQVRVVGEAAQPQAVPYRVHMTVLDAMIAVGGLTQFAAGNRATLVRSIDGKEQSFGLKLDDLLKDGDIQANVDLQPGDVIIIPQSYF